ncbi:hypothetical protein PIROE2DRAFT_13487 [Piromyces sp. E2]|nr:hypothetical protein PIROE2DRAFT_13487 [Piromyces sp. E2]|eukprot:OUM60670.1 hypothetical protein PIROE2DRAFT_13487 [Piromyces sp. E2]
MEELIKQIDITNKDPFIKLNIYQKIVNSFILSPFFPWVMVILILNRNNCKRPVMVILIAHWIFRSIGEAFQITLELYPNQKNIISRSNKYLWYIGIGVSNIFSTIGEVIGDWYPFLRTKVLINNKNKIRVVFITCILYNSTKIFRMIFFFIHFFFLLNQSDDINKRKICEEEFSLSYWFHVAIIQIFSFIYDLSVIVCLNQNLFRQFNIHQVKPNKFLENFKKISEYRIIISMIAIITFFPFILAFIFFIIQFRIKNETEVPFDGDAMNNLRKTVIDINFIFMYIDQILLRYYINYNQQNNTKSSSKIKYQHDLRLRYHSNSEPLISKLSYTEDVSINNNKSDNFSDMNDTSVMENISLDQNSILCNQINIDCNKRTSNLNQNINTQIILNDNNKNVIYPIDDHNSPNSIKNFDYYHLKRNQY